MMKRTHGAAGLCLLLGCLVAQPVMALSTKATSALKQLDHNITTDEAQEAADLSTHSASLNNFLPELMGSSLYLYLLQSDQFITLQGVIEALWEEHMIKKS
ncbi:MAG: hypothetical protein L3K52_00540 [Candidatus Thiothrix sulfatifontis]|nr:MAG: hypothetical protein L3K52_00540 [Candidatus Thiothrix sulfatifontis]